MTLKTWKDEFYSKKPSKRMTKIEALEHSLVKWSGLTKAKLEKHEVYWDDGKNIRDVSDDLMRIDSETCALCVKYLHPLDKCCKCPLFELGNTPCDGGDDSPYVMWVEEGNPKPMIRTLTKALKIAKQEND